MKLLLAIDAEACSEEAGNEVGRRAWGGGTTVRVLRAVGKFVPPAQELWYDAGGTSFPAKDQGGHRACLR